jgi:hypothetical protein
VEADLLRYYPSIDLMDLWRGKLSFRRLALCIRYLPSDSWTQTELRNEREDSDLAELARPDEPVKFGPWALENYQLAQLRDEIAELRFVVARTAGSEKYPEPTPTPRPGMRKRRAVEPGLTEAAVLYLSKLRPTGG